MKTTRFAQSCALVETKGKRILVDPGYLLLDEETKQKWTNIDIILVTHKHPDHCHTDSIKEIMKDQKTKFFTTKEVADAYPDLSPQIVKEGDILEDGVKIEVVKAVHGFIPPLKGGKEINENVGYIIDDGEKRAYFTSDTICFDNDYKCDVLFVPVVNHGVVMSPFEAALFAKATQASLVIPVHYDNPKHPADFEQVKKEFEARDLNYKILELGETIKI